jgi:hypothetical protein
MSCVSLNLKKNLLGALRLRRVANQLFAGIPVNAG